MEMEVEMKKWISFIMVFALLLAVIPPITVSAAAGGGELIVNGNNVTITLDIPEGKTENITSLRFQVVVTVNSGSMSEPSFRFSDTIKSTVKDVVVNQSESEQYIIDIILSGKKDEKIFDSSGKAQIGTLILKPASIDAKATVVIAGDENSSQPVVTIVNSIGQASTTVLLENVEPVIVTNTGSSSSGGGSGGGGAVVISTPRPSASPDVTASPAPDVTPNGTSAPEPDNTGLPNDYDESFLKNAKPTLKATVKTGSKNISFKWNKIAGAEGYIIYKYNANTGRYIRQKAISSPDTTTCSIKFAYATTYSFRMHAFKTEEDGSRTYGAFSSIVKVTTAPSKVQGLIVKQKKGSNITISWKKVARASGYQILMSKKKNGTYSCIKTIKRGSVRKCTIKKKNARRCYYRVRAYVNGAGKKRVYGNKSNAKSA